MSRQQAVSSATAFFDRGDFFNLLAQRITFQTDSRRTDKTDELRRYLTGALIPYLTGLDFTCRIVENPAAPALPFLIASRQESPQLPTILIYGHGDTVPGMEKDWDEGLSPWELTQSGDRWYGRGAADNKGQHSINLAALEILLKEEGNLGFNVKVLIEMGEEAGSPGLHDICLQERKSLAADVLIASDGPRIDPSTPTIFGGSRGAFDFDLVLTLREGGHHSGNWGGLLANPGIILSHALASMVDRNGRIRIPALRPGTIPEDIRKALARLTITGEGGPDIDKNWGEPGLTPAEKVYGWNTLEVLAFTCGNPDAPVNAIPPDARARCHIRFTADMDPATFIPAIRKHLDDSGLYDIQIHPMQNNYGTATRMSPDNPWVKFTTSSFEKTLGQLKAPREVAFLPNLGGTLPNDAFSDILGLPTVWVPHSYGGCSQHAPNEHLLEPLVREGLQLMTGLFWDLANKWEADVAM